MHDKPQPSRELQVYFYLQGRKSFTSQEHLAYQNLRKGLKGEMDFSILLQNYLTNNYLVLYDILLEYRNTFYQLDCLLIFPQQISLIEIKHFHGNFQFKNDHFTDCNSGREFRNPLHQLKRSTIMLQELFQKLQINLALHPQLLFNHPQFTLFEAKQNTPIVLPTQIPSYLHQLNQIPGHIGQHHYKLTEQIKRLHIPMSPYERLPSFEYKHLEKGVLCRDCRGIMTLEKMKLVCTHCTYRESLDSGVLRNTIEYNILFPSKKIQTSVIHAWCALNLSQRTISRILFAYLQPINKGRATEFLFANLQDQFI